MSSDFSLGVSTNNAIAQFSEFLHSTVNPKNTLTIEPDGQIHRYTVDGDSPSTKNGAYALYLDGKYQTNLPAGYVQNWKTGDKFKWKYEPSDDERKEYGRELHSAGNQAQREKEHKERERRQAGKKRLQEKKQAQARAKALAEYKKAGKIEPFQHAYLQSKFAGTGITYRYDSQFETQYGGEPDDVDYTVITNYPPKLCRSTIEGGICKAGELLIPMRDIATSDFATLIRIPDKPDDEGHWPKKYYAGLSPKGAAYIIRPQHAQTEAIYVCEGFATAIAVMITLKSRYLIMAAGSCHNLLPVCQALRGRYTGKIIIVADNDKAGVAGAEKCVSEHVADTLIKPETAGFDWCDQLVTDCGERN